MFTTLLFLAAGCSELVAPVSSPDAPPSPADSAEPACEPEPERCNGLDDDCDAVVDEEAEDASYYWLDKDGDGFAGRSEWGCPPAQAVGDPGETNDCDDDDANVHPGAVELCNGFDDDCDGQKDEANAVGCVAGYVDDDGDGYGSEAVCSCPGAEAFATLYGDCDAALPPYSGLTGRELMASLAPVAEITGLTEGIDGYGDVDGDGWPDVVSGGSVLHGPAAGAVAAADVVIATLPEPEHAIVADLDGDGRSDVIYSDGLSWDCAYDHVGNFVCTQAVEVRVYMSPLAPEPAPPLEYLSDLWWAGDFIPGCSHTLAAVDADGNGDDELMLLLDCPAGDSAMYTIDAPSTEGGGLWDRQIHSYDPGFGGTNVQELEDLDGDGFEDLLWWGFLYYGPLAPSLPAAGPYLGGWGDNVSISADLDGDGARELGNELGGALEIGALPTADADWADLTTGRLLAPCGADSASPSLVADVDGDGADDVVFVVAWPNGQRDLVAW